MEKQLKTEQKPSRMTRLKNFVVEKFGGMGSTNKENVLFWIKIIIFILIIVLLMVLIFNRLFR